MLPRSAGLSTLALRQTIANSSGVVFARELPLGVGLTKTRRNLVQADVGMLGFATQLIGLASRTPPDGHEIKYAVGLECR